MQAGCVDTPCGWDRPADCCSFCDDDADKEALLDLAWDIAVEWAFIETGYQFPGWCDAEVDPCPPCGCVGQMCGCGDYMAVPLDGAFCYPIRRLAEGPALQIVQRDAAGVETLINAADNRWVLEADGLTMRLFQPSSTFWDFALAESQFNLGRAGLGDTWSIRATIGREPPGLLLRGLAKFACELVKDCLNEETCLPDGVKSITRRGLTMDVGPELSETISFENNGTGIPVLDLAIRRWGIQAQSVAAIFDPMHREISSHRSGWTFHGRYHPTPFV